MTNVRTALLLLASLALFSGSLSAGISVAEFEDPAKERLYRQLVSELRCLVCQNQSLSDSNAELAVDLRRQVHAMVGEGDSAADVADYMVARYGEFVLYKPPVSARTLVLWLGPVFALLCALLIAWRISGSRQMAEQGGVSEADIARARDLLNK